MVWIMCTCKWALIQIIAKDGEFGSYIIDKNLGCWMCNMKVYGCNNKCNNESLLIFKGTDITFGCSSCECDDFFGDKNWMLTTI
jgi:hypothetical protein